jgi:glycosyltransferase involved in cell wall biosynthesis
MKKLIRITTVPNSLERLLEHQLGYMQQHYAVTAISSNEERLKQISEKEGVSVYAVELTRQITPLSDLKALYKLYKFFKKEKPAIVHTHTPKAGTIGMLAAFLAGVPHRLHTVAGLPLLEQTGRKRTLLNFVEKLTYACCTKIYPNSHTLSDMIIKHGFCKKSKVKVIANGSSNGINTSWYNPELFTAADKARLSATLNIPEGAVVFIYVGRLVKDKGINELVSAFKSVNQLYPLTRLLLVGIQEPELDPLLPKTIEEMERNAYIICTGFQADVRPYFAISDVLAFPSYREGFPNVVMQAGAMGLPCIVTDINGCNEIITAQVNGLIIPVKDSSALCAAMLSILVSREVLSRLQSNARPVIVEKFEQQQVWDAILAEYKALGTH